MELWVGITIGAAFLQNLRSMLQKQVTDVLSVNGASYTRFVFALPFAWLYLAALAADAPVPAVHGQFLVWCAIGGIGQIAGTAFLIASFGHGSFSLGTAFSKTEVVQTALVGLLVLGDTLSGTAGAGILVSFLGVLALSLRDPLRGPAAGRHRALVLGLLSGAGFAVAAVSYRAASLSLESGTFVMRAGTTLAATLTLQTLIMGAWLALREPGEIGRVLRSWRRSVWVGLIGAAASAGWFTAMTLTGAALVRALGQIELLFTFAASIWFFREPVRARELAGAGLVVLGIWLLLL